MNPLLKNWKILFALFCIIIAIWTIAPNPFSHGVVIKGVVQNSSAMQAGITPSKQGIMPMSMERITAINNQEILNLEEYYQKISELQPNTSILIQTNKGTYRLFVQPETVTETLNETEDVIISEFNETTNITTNRTETRQKTITKIIGAKELGVRVAEAPKTNLRLGLDVQGGTRVLLQPVEPVTEDIMSTLIENMKTRLNVYGLSDVVVKEVKVPFEQKSYILVEMAGVTADEVKDLMSKQGKFEAKIGNNTVFKGGQDITYVCRTSGCSGIDYQRGGCGQSGDGWACTFSFQISLSPEAAQRMADITNTIPITTEKGEKYLTEKLALLLDDAQVDELNIAADLKGRAVTDISISGSGSGINNQQAVTNTQESMKRLQTILITGSLPVKLEITKTDVVSAKLGQEFLMKAILAGFIAIILVTIVLIIAYRRIILAIPIMLTSMAEGLIVLGIAALIGWSIDLAAIAGIIAALGTGVNDQVIITNESMQKSEGAIQITWKERIKRAFFIIFSAYFTLLAAMLPLVFAGAGLLKGFAITTILAVTAGVFITRPAFAALIEYLLEKN